MRADRLLSILMLLQTKGKVTAQELAEELEVSERTIYRDITALGTAGVPVYSIRGPGGGISLLETYRSDLTGLNRNEVKALFMLNIPAALVDLGLDQELKAAMLKLSASLPTTLRKDQELVSQQIYVDPKPWDGQRPGPIPFLPALHEALIGNQVVFLRYYVSARTWVGPLESYIHPFGLVNKGGSWYLIGRRLDHIAVLRVDQIIEIKNTGQHFCCPESFDLVEFWDSWCLDEANNHPRFPVTVRVSVDLLPTLTHLFAKDLFSQTDSECLGPNLELVVVELLFEYHEQALEKLLPFGGAVEILEPVALRMSVIDYAEQILAVYSI